MLPPLLTPLRHRTTDEGRTVKSVWRLHDGALVESVLMRYPHRVTICVSSQAGCGMGCPFCATGQGGLTRNLSTAEIVEQVVAAARALRAGAARRRPRASSPLRVSNVVFMGMGEALANYRNAVGALRRLTDPSPDGLGISARGVPSPRSAWCPPWTAGGRGHPGHPGAVAARPRRPAARRAGPGQHPLERRRRPRRGAPPLPGHRAAGVDRVRPHPRRQRPSVAGRPARRQAGRPRTGVGARQPDSAQPHSRVALDRVAARSAAAVRRAAARARHTDDGARYPGPRYRRCVRAARGQHGLTGARVVSGMPVGPAHLPRGASAGQPSPGRHTRKDPACVP